MAASTIELYLRTFPGWERLREAVASVLRVDKRDVRAKQEGGDPAVLLDCVARPIGFQATATIAFVRGEAPPLVELARDIARALAVDVATSLPEYDSASRWLLARTDGALFVAEPVPRADRVLILEERADRLVAWTEQEWPA